MISLTAIKAYIQGMQFSDPRLYDVLIALVDRLQVDRVDIQEIQNELVSTIEETISLLVPPVTTFNYNLLPDYLQLTWEQPVDPEGETVQNYEIRKLESGLVWETGTRLIVTGTTTALLNPLTAGTHYYAIKSIGTSGNYSAAAKLVTVIVPAISAVSLTSTVIDNNVLLFWNAPTSSFRITHYELTRNGILVGTKDGTFTSYFEQIAGTYSYGIIPIDVAGNEGPESVRDVVVNQPPDYVLEDEIESTFTGTVVNGLVESNKLFVCIDNDETWEEHFTDNSNTTIQDFIDDGYDYWLEPAETTGSYTEVFDFGEILSNVIVNVSWAAESLKDTISVTCKLDTSEDNVTWAGQTTTTSLFVESLRYLEVELTFSGGIEKLGYIFDLSARLDVKREADSGSVSALASDASGTVVNFNKSFRDVESIVTTVNDTVEKNAIVDFTDAPNPTSFKVLVYDAGGSRVNATVYWVARGVI